MDGASSRVTPVRVRQNEEEGGGSGSGDGGRGARVHNSIW